MALSGMIYGTTDHSQVEVAIDWSATQSVQNNTSTVTAVFYARRKNTGFTTYGTFVGSVWIHTSSQAINKQVSIGPTQAWVELGRTTSTIGHSAEGALSLGIGASGAIPGTGWNTTSCGATVILDTIPRASTFSLSSSPVMGSPLTISIDRASSSFTHAVKYAFGTTSGPIAADVNTSTGWTPPLTLATQIPNAASGSLTITVETYSGATLIGTKSASFTLSVPGNMVPTIGTLTVTDPSGALTAIGGWVQNASIVRAVLGSIAGVQGSTIVSRTVTVAGQTLTDPAATQFDIPLDVSGSVTVIASVTDSRGMVGSKTQNLTVLPYSPPVFAQAPSAKRATSAGVLSELGTYLKLAVNATATSLKPGAVEKNAATFTLKSRPINGAWTTLLTSTPGGLIIADTSTRGGTQSADTSYEISFEISDKLKTTTRTLIIPTGAVPLSLAKGGIGVNKIWEQGALDVAGSSYFTGNTGFTGEIRQNNTLLGNLYGPGKPMSMSGSPAGLLIKTDIPLAGSIFLLISLRRIYLPTASMEADLEQYTVYWYNSASWLKARGIAVGGGGTLHAFFVGGFLHLWVPATTPSERILVELAAGMSEPDFSANHRITSMTDAAKPTSGVTNSLVITARAAVPRPIVSTIIANNWSGYKTQTFSPLDGEFVIGAKYTAIVVNGDFNANPSTITGNLSGGLNDWVTPASTTSAAVPNIHSTGGNTAPIRLNALFIPVTGY